MVQPAPEPTAAKTSGLLESVGLFTRQFGGGSVLNQLTAMIHVMKTLFAIMAIFLVVGCESSRRGALLTTDQAGTLAVRLANEQAATLYHCRPFRGSHPASFEAGHWVWAEQQGFGRGDIQAAVELAADGSTNHVVLHLLDSQNSLPF